MKTIISLLLLIVTMFTACSKKDSINSSNYKMTFESSIQTTDIGFKAPVEDRASVWIDLNNNGTQDAGEKINDFGDGSVYSLGPSKSATIYGSVTSLDIYYDIQKLDVSGNPTLTNLNCSRNNLSSLDLSKNTQLTNLNCMYNSINGADMTAFIRSLPKTNSGYALVYGDTQEGNSMPVTEDLVVAKTKGWKLYKEDSNGNRVLLNP